MAAAKHSTTFTAPAARIVYQTARITIVRLAWNDYELKIDGSCIGFFSSESAAMHEAGVRLHAEMVVA